MHENKILLSGNLKKILKEIPGKKGGAIVEFLLYKGGTNPQQYRICASTHTQDDTDTIKNAVGEDVLCECYLNGKQFSNGEEKFFNELKLVAFK